MSDDRKERFTPGPWEVSPMDRDKGKIFRIMKCGEHDDTPAVAYLKEDAALIATAPEMYALLAEIDGLQVADVSGPMKDVLACVDFRGRVNAVLKKARGDRE